MPTTRQMPSPPPATDVILIGVSSCLLGNQVRYDGGHKRSAFVTDRLGRFVTFVPVCPEVDLGLGVPRETIRLQQVGEQVRLVAPRSGSDHTAAMQRYARTKVQELSQLDLCGYVLKKDSPTCGKERVRLHTEDGVRRTGVGVFARVLQETHPHLPIEEEGRLQDPALRENFVERVFAYRRLRSFFATSWRAGDMVRFHTAEKLLLLAHDRPCYTQLGRIVAAPRAQSRTQLESDYIATFMRGLSRLATVRKHTNVLQHALGHLRKRATVQDRQDLADRIDDYHRGLVPLIVPITLMRHLVRRYDIDYLRGQTYLEPHPKELMLRNHV